MGQLKFCKLDILFIL